MKPEEMLEELWAREMIKELTYAYGLAIEGQDADRMASLFTEDGSVDFRDIKIEDLKHSGRLRPVGARHFVEKAQAVQNLNQIFASPFAADELFLAHRRPLQMAKAVEDLLDLEKFQMVSQNIRIVEAAETAAMQDAAQQQVQRESLVDVEEEQ